VDQEGYQDRKRRRAIEHVVDVWQENVNHVLDDRRRQDFLHRREVSRLATCPSDRLEEAAALARSRNPNGHLLLVEWWNAAEDLRLEESAKVHAEMEAAPPEVEEALGPIVQCPACGIGIDYYSGRCGCQ
jgi:hypothetical protein